MKDLSKNILSVIKQFLSYLAGLWFVLSLIAAGAAFIGWRDFVSGDFIFGMIVIANIGYFFAIAIQYTRIVELQAEVSALKKTAPQPATDEPPSRPIDSYTDSEIQAEAEAAKERELNLPPDDWQSWEQPE